MLKAFLLWLCIPLIYSLPVRNNVCKNLGDYATIQTNKKCYYNSDVNFSPSQIASRYGFPFESYKVKTEDGYILSLFRIPYSETNKKSGRQPVMIQHGLFSSAATWLLLGKDSLAFFLVNNGYDVWLGNFRGTKYSTEHENLAITDKEYWNFSFHEVGMYDLPASIEFISNTTGNSIIYIGHSMGTTTVFVYSSLRKKHAEQNLKEIVALAPVAYMKHLQGLTPVLSQHVDLITDSLQDLGFFAVGQFIDIQKFLASTTCNTYPLIIVCQILISLFTGLALEQVKPEIFPLITNHLPTGTPVKNLRHYSQVILSNGRFQFYDYGPSINMALYNSSLPPEYPVEQISVPVHLFVGNEDFIADYEDVKYLYDKLKCDKSIHIFEMAHNDFFSGRHVESFYETLLEVMKINIGRDDSTTPSTVW